MSWDPTEKLKKVSPVCCQKPFSKSVRPLRCCPMMSNAPPAWKTSCKLPGALAGALIKVQRPGIGERLACVAGAEVGCVAGRVVGRAWPWVGRVVGLVAALVVGIAGRSAAATEIISNTVGIAKMNVPRFGRDIERIVGIVTSLVICPALSL